ncbi:MAG: family 16 glycoside hydrolase, partial [Planctomycetota bacterium]|nr:family 16 glycoside hydrolase [Planctomycetota bacterium]
MKKTTWILLSFVLFANGVEILGQEWVPLFDGRSLKGWVQKWGQARYEVIDGAIVGKTVPNTPNSFLVTEKIYGDFELELEFMVHPELNSGIQIRSNSLSAYKNGRVHGYQVEIDPSERAWSGGICDEGRRGWLNTLKDNNAARYAFKMNGWNHYRVRAVGNRIRTWVNDVAAADLQDSLTARGFIGLQVHGVGGRKDELTVRWRNIRIRENPESLEEKELPAEGQPGKIFAGNAKIRKLAAGFMFTEGPAVGPDGKIYFNDIPNSRTHVFDPRTGKTAVWKESTGRANGLFWTANDKLVACEGGNRKLTITSDGRTRVVADRFEGQKFNSPNDVALDTVGGMYFTD